MKNVYEGIMERMLSAKFKTIAGICYVTNPRNEPVNWNSLICLMIDPDIVRLCILIVLQIQMARNKTAYGWKQLSCGAYVLSYCLFPVILL